MKVTYNWLKDFVDLNGISAEEVAQKLTVSGFEVEDILYQNKFLHDVYMVPFVDREGLIVCHYKCVPGCLCDKVHI